ncbi:DUF3060 domain-containing protein [Archangium violaceum]|uniref:DUF3060 domain-containing protein n=1 Tax=Archangium violaceum TaxID=83451 RepID=UPI002B2ED3EF|nr:DUF3060 domain-containing protein [Archangium gephyra]
MSSFIRGTMLSGVVAGLLLAPAVGVAQGGSVKVGKDGSVQVRGGNTTVNTQGAETQGGSVKVGKDGSVQVRGGNTTVNTQGAEELGGADVEVGDEGASVKQQAGAALEIVGSESQESHRCSPKTEVNISGSDNEITLTGECKRVSVSGSTNMVKVEAAAAIEVMGSDNQVTWKREVGGKKPKVTRTGSNNKVTQAR